VKALKQVGARRILWYAWASVLLLLWRCTPFPPLRAMFLRLCGASVGSDTVIQPFRIINLDRGGFRSLQIGQSCYIGDDVLLDLASVVLLEEHVTLATRTTVLTHLNVGYADHPLQERFPSRSAAVRIRRGSFIGAGTLVLPGVTIGPRAFVAAGSVVNRDVGEDLVVGGVPARVLPQPESENDR
jgi:acetyltransferase-like isoleucine patch superfamily enzyme